MLELDLRMKRETATLQRDYPKMKGNGTNNQQKNDLLI